MYPLAMPAEGLATNTDTLSRRRHLLVNERSRSHLLAHSSIVRCEALSNYTFIHLTSGQKILVSKCLKVIESELSSAQFLRIHAKHLVNISAIASVQTSPKKRGGALQWFATAHIKV